MKIKIVGAAAGEVTGSAYYVQTEQAKILLDAGMFQGGKKSETKNRLPSGVNLSKLDAVLLTHAHLDHSVQIIYSSSNRQLRIVSVNHVSPINAFQQHG
jgi:metallo-beta-lactamase family protein